jgi:hypothetical protein
VFDLVSRYGLSVCIREICAFHLLHQTFDGVSICNVCNKDGINLRVILPFIMYFRGRIGIHLKFSLKANPRAKLYNVPCISAV